MVSQTQTKDCYFVKHHLPTHLLCLQFYTEIFYFKRMNFEYVWLISLLFFGCDSDSDLSNNKASKT